MSLRRGRTIGRRRERSRVPLLLPALVAALAVAGFLAFRPGWEVRGRVVDATTGLPVAGAAVSAPTAAVRADEAGTFRLSSVRPGDSVALAADGYLPLELKLDSGGRVEATLHPRALRLRVFDAETGRPLAAEVSAEVAPVSPHQGLYLLSPIRSGSRIAIHAQGYAPSEVEYADQEQIDVPLRPLYRGTVRSAASGQPIARARVIADGTVVRATDRGEFELPARPRSGRAFVLAPGYRAAELDLARHPDLQVALHPFAARGVYLTFFGAAHPELRGNVLRLLDDTHLNSLVVDVKGDRGWIAYRSGVPLAERIGANELNTLPDVQEFLRDLKARSVYTIARIVVFKDDLLARNGPQAGLDVAIKDAHTGGPWIDGEGLGWVDPFREETWDYNIALAVEAARKGFDEIQFDYIRFPTDPSADTAMERAVYARPSDERGRVEALASFLQRAREAVNQAGAYLSIDTFGYTSFADDDMGIGQHLASLAPHVDYISPMLYPSTYQAGLPGRMAYPQVVSDPYRVVYESVQQARARLAGSGALLRPWLQYFDDYPWATRYPYNAEQIVAQQNAARDSGAVGWLFWDPTNRYERGGFAPKGAGE